jgi:hypothetical protein
VSRFLLLLLALAPLLIACDSDDGPSGPQVDGFYQATSYTFRQDGGSLIGTVDILSHMAQVGGEPQFTLDLFGRDNDFNLVYRLEGATARSNISGSFSTAADNRVTVGFGDNNRDAVRVLLPPSLTFSILERGAALSGSANTTVSFEQLAELDPDRFGGLSNGTVRGTLTLTFERR